MKIGIICAMEEELASIVKGLNLTGLNSKQHNSFTVYTAQYLHHELAFILSGIGKVNAALHTQYIIDKINPQAIINVGVAGSLSMQLNFGDIVIAKDLVQYDMNVESFGLPLGQIPRMKVFAFPSDSRLLYHAQQLSSDEYKIVIGRIATGDKFVADSNHAKFIGTRFNALACEMEGAAVAQTCYINQIPCLIVRALSDMAGRDDVATYSYKELKDMAANRSSFVVKQLLYLI